MEADSDLPEEGEITDDPDDHYTPLERPAGYSTQTTSNLTSNLPICDQDSDSEDELESSSGSDSDVEKRAAKRPKFKPRPRAASASQICRNKYSIWNSRAQEDLLLENLINCDVSQVDRSRSVETYPVRNSNKRSFADRRNRNLKPVKKSDDEDRDEETKSTPRILLDLTCTLEDDEDTIARDIANKLFETKQDLIERVVREAGKEKTFSIYKEVKRIEAEGGMLIMNQTRRRTPGGVFLFFVKHDNELTREQLNNIFIDERLKSKLHVQERKRQKAHAMKQRIANSKKDAQDGNFPDLLTRAELCMRKLAEESSCGEEGQEAPPPSPVTDGHDNSTDGMESLNGNAADTCEKLRRKLNSYSDDFLDVGCGNDMDLF